MTTAFTYLRNGNIERQKEWDPENKISLEYRGNEFAGEAGEVCNEVKKLARERLGIAGSRTTVEKLASEAADAVICLDLICMDAGIDLFQAVKNKFNETSERIGLKTRL